MIIYLPKTLTGLKKLEENLSKLQLNPADVLKKLSSYAPKLYFSLPKFKMESSFDIVGPLQKVSLLSCIRLIHSFQDLGLLVETLIRIYFPRWE